MNEHFVNIKVDREERPDVDRLYMSFLQASTGGGGWPMSVCECSSKKTYASALTENRAHARPPPLCRCSMSSKHILVNKLANF